MRFETTDGRVVRFRSGTRSYPAPYARGEVVTVLYRAGEPERAEIAAFRSVWLATAVCGGLGLVFLVVGLLALR